MSSMTIRANIIGDNRCEAEGHSVRGRAPVLDMCRKLVAAGFDPTATLEANRGDVLRLQVRTIGEGAKLK